MFADGSGGGPWSWSVSDDAWYERLSRVALRWTPHPGLGVAPEYLRRSLVSGIEQRQKWLWHPCVNRLTQGCQEHNVLRDAQLAVWIAANGPVDSETIILPADCWIWTEDGGEFVTSGPHQLDALARMVKRRTRWAVSLDVWSRTTPEPVELSWTLLGPLTEQQSQTLSREIRLFFRVQEAIERLLPTCHRWLTNVTKVVVPLQGESDRWHSGSSAGLPGLVWTNLNQGGLKILEALVHESAHQYMTLAEAHGPLVDPTDTATYRSPLRSDPRPLYGIMLAYHALAYMCAAYVDAASAGLYPEQAAEDLGTIAAKMNDAQATIQSNRRHLTRHGVEFFERTAEVGRYGMH